MELLEKAFGYMKYPTQTNRLGSEFETTVLTYNMKTVDFHFFNLQ